MIYNGVRFVFLHNGLMSVFVLFKAIESESVVVCACVREFVTSVEQVILIFSTADDVNRDKNLHHIFYICMSQTVDVTLHMNFH